MADDGVLERLTAAGHRRRAAAAELDAANTEAEDAIRAALAENIPVGDIARRTGYHRNSISLMRDQAATSRSTRRKPPASTTGGTGRRRRGELTRESYDGDP